MWTVSLWHNYEAENPNWKGQVFKFLMGLNNSFEMVRWQLILLDLYPPWIELTLWFYQKRNKNKPKLFLSSSDGCHCPCSRLQRQKAGARFILSKVQEGKSCHWKVQNLWLWKKGGHLIDTCYQIHRYPENDKGKKYIAGSSWNTKETLLVMLLMWNITPSSSLPLSSSNICCKKQECEGNSTHHWCAQISTS